MIQYPSRRAPACPKAKGIPRGEPASRDGWTHPLPKAFGALSNKGRENHQASSNSRPPSTAGDADAGAGCSRSSLHYGSTTSKANAGAGGMHRQCPMPKRGTPVISKAPQRVPPRVEASGGTNSRCKVTDMTRKEGKKSWKQNYSGDGAALEEACAKGKAHACSISRQHNARPCQQPHISGLAACFRR